MAVDRRGPQLRPHQHLAGLLRPPVRPAPRRRQRHPFRPLPRPRGAVPEHRRRHLSVVRRRRHGAEPDGGRPAHRAVLCHLEQRLRSGPLLRRLPGSGDAALATLGKRPARRAALQRAVDQRRLRQPDRGLPRHDGRLRPLPHDPTEHGAALPLPAPRGGGRHTLLRLAEPATDGDVGLLRGRGSRPGRPFRRLRRGRLHLEAPAPRRRRLLAEPAPARISRGTASTTSPRWRSRPPITRSGTPPRSSAGSGTPATTAPPGISPAPPARRPPLPPAPASCCRRRTIRSPASPAAAATAAHRCW